MADGDTTDKKGSIAAIVIAVISALASVAVAIISTGNIRTTAKEQNERLGNQSPIVGEIRAFASEKVPPGWMECAGQSLETDKYKTLYENVGRNWGSSDSEHFNLPDLRGMFLRGWNNGKTENDSDLVSTAKDTQWFDDNASKRRNLRRNGVSGDRVGTYQEDGVGPHAHYIANSMGVRSDNPGNFEFTSNAGFTANPHLTDKAKDVGESRLNKETTPKNATVLYAIYVGQTAAQEQ